MRPKPRAPDDSRLQQQIQFLTEIDKLKKVLRRTWLLDQSRYENDAEHSWHIAVAAMMFAEYADDPKVDVLRVIKMLLVHDLVEIDAGDTYAYDEKACLDQAERNRRQRTESSPCCRPTRPPSSAGCGKSSRPGRRPKRGTRRRRTVSNRCCTTT